MEARGQLGPFAGTSAQRYAVDRKIASGGMATVYLGRALGAHGFERRVAIKACHPHLLDDEARRHALVDEARVAARIRHPNVVATLDVVPRDGSLLIVMEYVEGVTLAELLSNEEPLPVPVALRIVLDVLAGLDAAHALGVIHRDVSPQNVLVGAPGVAKLADFGVSKSEGRLVASTETGEVKGKLGYVAPEVYRGEPVTPRADVYAVGVVLWEALAGRRLFEGASHASVMQRVLRGTIPPLMAAREDVPMELDAVLARATARDTAGRFAGAEELARALESLAVPPAAPREVARYVRAMMKASGVEESVPPPPLEVTPVRRATRPPGRLAVAGVALALATSAFVVSAKALHPEPARRAHARELRALPLPVVIPLPSATPSASPAPSAAAAPSRPLAPPRATSSAKPPRFYDPKEL